MHTFKSYNLEDFSACDFRLVNAGFSVNSANPIRTINRVRPDYYLFYVYSGHVIIDYNTQTPQTLKKGDFFFYLPQQEQNYCIDGNEKTRIVWVHFLGKEVDELISLLNLKQGKINVKPSSPAPEIFSKLLKEHISKNIAFETMSKSLLYNLLITLSRDKAVGTETFKTDSNFSMVTKIISLINENPRISNYELAKSVNLSTDHFVRVFKNAFKTTPHKYKLDIIIESAKSFLTKSTLTISQIAETLGYENDGLYFNASFKKHVGLSPTEYREKFKTE